MRRKGRRGFHVAATFGAGLLLLQGKVTSTADLCLRAASATAARAWSRLRS